MEWTSILNTAHDAVITPGAAHADTVTASIQLKDYATNNLKVRSNLIAYLSDVSTGLAITATVLTTDMTATTGHLIAIVAKSIYILGSDASGVIGVTMGYTTAAHDYFLVVILPNGKKVVSTKLELT